MKSEEKKETKQKTKTYKKYTIDFSAPLSNNLLTLEGISKYLELNMKVNGLKGKLGDSIKISIADKNNIMIQVESTLEFSKKYLKYLTKKYLKKEGIEKYMTINANSPNGYTVKIIKKNNEA